MPINVAHGGAEDGLYGSGAIPHRTIAINIESMRLYLSSLVARIMSRVSVDTLRSLPMFLGLNPGAGFCLSPVAFTPPVKTMDKMTIEKIRSRVRMNFTYFLTNYVLIASMTALVVALMHPGMVFFLVVIYLLWTLHAFLIRNQLVIYGLQVHALLNVQLRFYSLFVLTTIVTVWKCLKPTLTFLAISSLLIITHALLRDPKHIESLHQQDNAYDHENESDEEGGVHSNDSGGSNESEVLVERPRTTATSSKATNTTTGRRRGVASTTGGGGSESH